MPSDLPDLVVSDEHPLTASLRFLSSASKTLASSYDFAQTLTRLAQTIVPEHAEGFAVEIIDQGARTVVATAGSLEHGIGARPDIVVPLVVRDRHLGAMHVVFARNRPSGQGFDQEIFEELGVRIAVAIDGAQVYAREHQVADTLQRALLPERLPSTARIRFDAAYLPGASEAIVGGDWYDAFELPDGRIACSVGNVAGHGLRAAIVMGEVRQAFRAAALNPKSPSLVLERANTIVNMRTVPVMVTAIFGILDPATATLTYATAGHPGPILALPDGTALKLPAEGIPLGIDEHTGARDWTFTLPPGSMIALYTDGLIEFSRDVIAGEKRVLEALRREVVSPSPMPARSLVSRVFSEVKNTDNVAVLAIVIDDAPEHDFAFEFSAIPIAVPLVRRALQRHLRSVALETDERFAAITAIGEAVANAVEHAYNGAVGTIRLRVTFDAGVLHAEIEDDGCWQAPREREERGRGIPLMRALMSRVEIKTLPTRTIVRLTLDPAEPKDRRR